MADPTNSQSIDDFLGVRQPPAWRRYAKWGLVALGVVLLALAARSWFAGEKAPDYAMQAVERGNLRVTVSATGKLAPTNQVTVGSQLSGLVTQVVVDVNDRVEKGQALALIDPEQLDDQIRQNQASLAANIAQVGQAQATVAESRAQLNRLEEVYRLSNKRVPSEAELQTGRANYQRAVAALKVAQANVTAAQASLAQSRTQRDRAVIRSPVSGVVLARQVDPGQTVAASFNTPTLFVIAQDLSAMQLEVAIDEADVGSVKEGQDARFTVDAFPGRTFPARILRVDLGSNLSAQAASSSSTTSTATTQAQVVSYGAVLSVANPNLQLRPGMTATADITTTSKNNVLLVPNAALRFRPQADGAGQGGGGIAGQLTFRGGRRGNRGERTATVGYGAQQTVFVKGEDGKPREIRIQTGDTDGSVTEVIGGDLRAGMQVITGQLAGDGDGSAGGQRSGAGGGQRRQGGGGAGGGQRGQ